MTCHWCGDTHGTDQLCQRAERGMTRRSFCFLFGAGIAGLALDKPETGWYYDAAGKFHSFTVTDVQKVDYQVIKNVGTFDVTFRYVGQFPFTIAPGQRMKVPNR